MAKRIPGRSVEAFSTTIENSETDREQNEENSTRKTTGIQRTTQAQTGK
tara:strand:- start:977 stop:1123 length:147 start_codon:yes stop_codon:yes gene_type:complete